MFYIGIDLGTSSVKLILIDDQGKIKKIANKEYPIYYPHHGWSEQNPSQWFQKTLEGIKDLTKDCDRSQISSIGICGQMHGLVILDKNDKLIRPAILWNDERSYEETEYLNNVIGTERLQELTGNIAFPGFTAPKLLWLKRNEPENFNKIHKIMLPKDYLIYKFTGIHCTDVSDASGTLLFDVKHKCWSDEMLAYCNITTSQLPCIYESFKPVGNIQTDIAINLGIPENVIFAGGAGDNAAAAIGTGTLGDESCNISIGTSGTIYIATNSFAIDKTKALHSFAGADGNYSLMGCILSAGSCNSWWHKTILLKDSLIDESTNITDEKLGNNYVFFLPYLIGERSPHNDPLVRGAFIGLTLESSRDDMTQAIMEGVAFAIKDSLEVAKRLGCPVKSSKICGGGSKSALWRKILVNVLNINLELLECEDSTCLGAAILSMVALRNDYSFLHKATENCVRVTSTLTPDPEISNRYAARYKKYREIYPIIKVLFPTIS